MLLRLPNELKIAIIRALDRDVPTLRNASLVCRDLLPFIHEELFAVMNARSLGHPSTHRHRRSMVKLVISDLSEDASSKLAHLKPLIENIRSCSLPRLKAIHFINVDTRTTFYMNLIPLPELLPAFSTCQTVTALNLSRVSFLDLNGAQKLICAFPHLRHLRLTDVTIITHEEDATSGNDLSAVELLRPRLASLFVSFKNHNGRSNREIAQWLGRSPSVRSIATLTVQTRNAAADIVLDSFGDSVMHLSMPLCGLDDHVYSGFLARFTNIRTLTVFLEAHFAREGPWILLPPFFECGIIPEHLHTITIEVRVAHIILLSWAIGWPALDRLNYVLDEGRFAALRKVIFVVHWEEAPGWSPGAVEKEECKHHIEQRLNNLVRAGKLETRLHGSNSYSH